ncbi:MAG: ATP-binding cassette domain-containing protein [Bryobacteraceae bacterium]|nr:ATP-binding cassette domain-containing protein [Bryobacteraceae bacterium]
MPPLIEYSNVTVSRGDRIALNSLTLSIGLGEHVAVLGPNGSGKSSLIKTITRECYPRLIPGSYLRILGQEAWNIFELRPLLGIVSNDLVDTCTGNYSGGEIVLSGFFSSVGIWPHHHVTEEMEARARAVMELLEISHLAERGMTELSTGEARRVLIARALVHDPKALVLDEPTASLDLHATYELRNILRKIAQGGTGVIMVTHHLHDIIPEIGRVILLKEGRVFADGPKHNVLEADTLAALFGTRFELTRRDGFYHLW